MPVRREGGVLKVLHHDAVVALAIPCIRIVGLGAHLVPDRLGGGGAAVRRHRVMHHCVAVFVPEREIVRRQHRRARLHRGEPIVYLAGIRGSGDRGIDARRLHRRNRPGGGQDPSFERVERRRACGQILRRLLEPEPDRIDDQMVEMRFAAIDRDPASVAGCEGARPQALELADAERAGFGRGREFDVFRGGRWCEHRVARSHRRRPRHARVPPLPAVERPRGPGR
jgi:hypothetical protein